MSEVLEVWEVLEAEGIFGVHRVLGWCLGRRNESKTPARSLAGEERQTWTEKIIMRHDDMVIQVIC